MDLFDVFIRVTLFVCFMFVVALLCFQLLWYEENNSNRQFFGVKSVLYIVLYLSIFAFSVYAIESLIPAPLIAGAMAVGFNGLKELVKTKQASYIN